MPSIGERLLEERDRLGLSQPAMADAGRVTMRSQRNYEKGERFPDATYLAAIAAVGADVRYIVTSAREGPAPEVLSADERYLLERYRGSPQPLKDAALRVLLGGEAPAGKSKKQVFNKEISGQVAMGKIINKGKKAQ